MDFAPHPEQPGTLPPQDNPEQEPSIEPNGHGNAPLSTASRNLTLIDRQPPRADRAPAHGLPIWLRRLMLFIFVAFSIEVGLFLVAAPWYDAGRLWSENSLLAAYPSVRAFLSHDFIRGLVSGLGLIDIWLGIWEAVHYREAIHS